MQYNLIGRNSSGILYNSFKSGFELSQVLFFFSRLKFVSESELCAKLKKYQTRIHSMLCHRSPSHFSSLQDMELCLTPRGKVLCQGLVGMEQENMLSLNPYKIFE